MNPTEFDVIVLGVGGVGTATLYHLAKRGLRVLGLDQFSLAHDRGSSHGETRVIRTAYFEHPDYVPLAQASIELWRELEATTQESLLFPVGLLQGGDPDGEVIQGVRRSAELHQLNVETWPASSLSERFPPLQCPSGHALVLEKNAGYLLVEECVRAHAAAAQQLGARIVCDESIRDWQSDNSGCTVQTANRSYRAQYLVLALGAGQRDLLRIDHLNLSVLKKHLYWYAFHPPAQWADRMSRLPIFLFELDAGDGAIGSPEVFYGFPSLDGQTIKVARHSGGTPVSGDPFTVDRSVDAEDQRSVERFLSLYFAEASFRLRRHATCLYTMSPDNHFRVGAHPDFPRVWLAAGLSGHGFKFVPVIASAIADLIETGCTEFPMGFLAP